MNILVSVIVPMYNVKDFIGKCAQQLFKQTLQNIEIIFVDDKSPDDSANIVADLLLQYPARQEQVKIIQHEINLGLPSARNTGLGLAKGEFIFHCDGDDWVEINALELLYNAAVNANADIVWCDWFLTFEKNERYISQNIGLSQFDVHTVLTHILSGKIRYNVWNKLVKHSLYSENQISFPDGFSMGEDMTMIKLFAVADKATYVPEALYHYVQLNNSAFTKKTTALHLEQVKHNVEDVISYLTSKFGNKLEEVIHFFKLNIKLPFLISDKEADYERWLSWYPESNNFIDKNPDFNFRTRFIQKMAHRRAFWVLKLYYYFVIRLVYGVIYK